MKKLFFILPLLFLFVSSAQADYPITILIEDTAPDSNSLFYCLKNPDGTPLNRKCKLGNMSKGIDHTLMNNIGSYSHLQIDLHINTDHLLQSELLDEDDMRSDDATKPASQQSTKFYVDSLIASVNSSISSLSATVETLPTVDTGPSPDCSGTATYQDGEGNCDDTSAFVISCSDGNTLGTDCGASNDLTNGFIVQIASGTLTLPAVATGYIGCVKATSAATINIDPNASDRFILDGTALADGDKLTSAGEIDDTICFYVDSAAGWTTMFNPHSFTDGN